MIERLLANKLMNRFVPDRTNNNWISDRILNITFGSWFGMGLLISYMAYEYGWDSSQCYLCNQLVNRFPSIDVAAAKSDYPSVMRIIWLYLAITTPLSFIGFISAIPYANHRAETRGWVWVISCIFVFGGLIYISIIYFLDGGPNVTGVLTKWNKLYMHTIFGAYFLCFSRLCMISFGSYILITIPFIFASR